MEHRATVSWQRTSDTFTYETYNRAHEWAFQTVKVPASSSPDFRGDPARVNPEEALVAALSSCHMLTFLAICTKRKYPLNSYHDEAVGYLEKNERGHLVMTRVVLRPQIQWSQGVSVPEADLKKMHQQAHEGCIIANSVKTTVVVEPRE